MADGTSTLEDAVKVENFGRNIEACAKLLGFDLDSLGAKADIDKKILFGYKLGTGKLLPERIAAIANVLGLSENTDVLYLDFADVDQRKDRMQMELIRCGVLKSEGDEGDGKDTASPESEIAEGQQADEAPDTFASDAGTDASPQVDPTPAIIGRNIRAAVKRAELKLLDTLAEAGIDVDKMFMAQYEKGKRELTDEQLARVAELTGASVEILHTGEGLEAFFPKVKSPGKSLVPVKLSVDLPPVSSEHMSAYFRERVLSRTVQLPEGVEVGQLMELALNQDNVDWPKAWLTLTAAGVKFDANLTKQAESLSKLGEVARIFYVLELVNRLWPPKEDKE